MRLTAMTAVLALSATAAFAEEKTLDIGVSDALTGGRGGCCIVYRR
jgi:branched-chain amino acid transport system substrate-binding protein